MKKSYTARTVHSSEGVFPFIEIWEQPLLRCLIARAYHRWEKYTEPAMRHISKWHRRVSQERTSLDYVPLVNRRDIKCYRLHQAKRNTLAIIDITQEQYDDIIGKLEPKVETS